MYPRYLTNLDKLCALCCHHWDRSNTRPVREKSRYQRSGSFCLAVWRWWILHDTYVFSSKSVSVQNTQRTTVSCVAHLWPTDMITLQYTGIRIPESMLLCWPPCGQHHLTEGRPFDRWMEQFNLASTAIHFNDCRPCSWLPCLAQTPWFTTNHLWAYEQRSSFVKALALYRYCIMFVAFEEPGKQPVPSQRFPWCCTCWSYVLQIMFR